MLHMGCRWSRRLRRKKNSWYCSDPCLWRGTRWSCRVSLVPWCSHFRRPTDHHKPYRSWRYFHCRYALCIELQRQERVHCAMCWIWHKAGEYESIPRRIFWAWSGAFTMTMNPPWLWRKALFEIIEQLHYVLIFPVVALGKCIKWGQRQILPRDSGMSWAVSNKKYSAINFSPKLLAQIQSHLLLQI